MPPLFRKLGLALCILLPSISDAHADEKISILLKDHVFQPARIEAPSGVKIEITVKNEDSGADEFDSRDLKREKIIGAGKEGIILVGPLQPGEYHFQGEYHAQTAQGVLVVK
jgi:hypothetical protein